MIILKFYSATKDDITLKFPSGQNTFDHLGYYKNIVYKKKLQHSTFKIFLFFLSKSSSEIDIVWEYLE